MDMLFPIAILAAIVLVAVYMYNVNQLYEIVVAEKPEWLRYKGEPSLLYANLPRRFDPNVSMRVLAVAFSQKAKQLASSTAPSCITAIRITLPLYLVVFSFICWYLSVYSEA